MRVRVSRLECLGVLERLYPGCALDAASTIVSTQGI